MNDQHNGAGFVYYILLVLMFYLHYYYDFYNIVSYYLVFLPAQHITLYYKFVS